MGKQYDFEIRLDEIDALLDACVEDTITMRTALVRGLAFELRRAWLVNELFVAEQQEQERERALGLAGPFGDEPERGTCG